jgi:hypothetical protein
VLRHIRDVEVGTLVGSGSLSRIVTVSVALPSDACTGEEG